MDTVRSTLIALSLALTGKTPDLHDVQITRLLEGQEFYLPDGGYSRLVVSLLTGDAFLTSNSRDEVKQAWYQCRSLIAAVEREVEAARKRIDPSYQRCLSC